MLGSFIARFVRKAFETTPYGAYYKEPVEAFCHYLEGSGKDRIISNNNNNICYNELVMYIKNQYTYGLLKPGQWTLYQKGYSLAHILEEMGEEVPNWYEPLKGSIFGYGPLYITVGGFALRYLGNGCYEIWDLYDWHDIDSNIPTKFHPLLEKLPKFILDKFVKKEEDGWKLNELNLNNVGKPYINRAFISLEGKEPIIPFDGTWNPEGDKNYIKDKVYILECMDDKEYYLEVLEDLNDFVKPVSLPYTYYAGDIYYQSEGGVLTVTHLVIEKNGKVEVIQPSCLYVNSLSFINSLLLEDNINYLYVPALPVDYDEEEEET